MNPILAGVFGVLIGYCLRMWLTGWLARRRLRCEVCGSETTPEGIGASSALGSDDDPFKNWGQGR